MVMSDRCFAVLVYKSAISCFGFPLLCSCCVLGILSVLVLKAIIFLKLFEFFVSRGLKWSGTILMEIFRLAVLVL